MLDVFLEICVLLVEFEVQLLLREVFFVQDLFCGIQDINVNGLFVILVVGCFLFGLFRNLFFCLINFNEKVNVEYLIEGFNWRLLFICCFLL